MDWFEILKVPIRTDWQSLDQILKHDRVAYRIVERRNEQVLLINNAQNIPLVRKRINEWQQGTLPTIQKVHADNLIVNKLKSLRHNPVVIIFAVLSILGFIIVELNLYEVLTIFTFQTVWLEAGQINVSSSSGLFPTHWWKLITPMFLHFGLFHLAFNLLWLFEFGCKIERVQSSSRLLLVVLLSGIVANISQYWYQPFALFGGFSGAVYGLLGYCMVQSYIYNMYAIRPRRGIPTVLIIWLAIGFSGLISALGIADIANLAHLSGFISGLIIGALPSNKKNK